MKSLSTSTTLKNRHDEVRNARSCVQDVQAFESTAKTLLQVRFPSIEQWLRARLLSSMTYRRVRCHYLMAKHSSARITLNVEKPGRKEMPASEEVPAPEPVTKVPQQLRKPTFRIESEETGKSDDHVVVKPASNVSRANKSASHNPSTIVMSTKASSMANDEALSIPPCPESPSSNMDFKCPYCKFILPSSEAVPSKWK